MKSLSHTFATLGLLALTASAAQAQTLDIAPQRIEIGAVKLAAPTDEIQGLYALSNGKLLQLSRSDSGVYAQLGQGLARELLPVAANRLRSRDGRMELAFSVQPDGSVTDIRLSLG